MHRCQKKSSLTVSAVKGLLVIVGTALVGGVVTGRSDGAEPAVDGAVDASAGARGGGPLFGDSEDNRSSSVETVRRGGSAGRRGWLLPGTNALFILKSYK